MKPVRVGSRQSVLAITQTKIVLNQLIAKHGPFPYEIVPIMTKGDRLKNASLTEIGGKGVFIKEVEHRLLDREIDFAVHSMKDMPATEADELIFAAIPKRANPQDCLIFRDVNQLADLPINAVIGTSSLRRKFQVPTLRKDLKTCHIRGNVGTRLEKIEKEKMDGIILAAAGLERLNWFQKPDYHHVMLPSDSFVPAPSQAALAVQCRAEDTHMYDFLRAINHLETEQAVIEERHFLRLLNGDCTIPVGALLERNGQAYKMVGMLGDQDSKKMVIDHLTADTPVGMGELLGRQLLRQLQEE